MASIRVSPRHLGKMKTQNFCPRCYWYQIIVGFHTPFEFPMPGIMHNLDRFEKKLVDTHYTEKGVLPRWLAKLGCTDIVEFPAKMTKEFPKHDLTLVGMPDAVFRKKDRSLYLVDYKTARYKGDEDPFLPVYETQLLGYAELLEDAGLGDVTSAALVYFENQAPAYYEEPLSLLSNDGFTLPLTVKIHPVELDRKAFPSLLKSFREYANMTAPPDGSSGCRDCKRLDQLLDTDTRLRNNTRSYSKSTDSYQRMVILDNIRRMHSEQLVSFSGQWEVEFGLRGTDCFDSTPADWDI